MIIVPPAIKPMGSIASSCVLDVDATIVDSYSGSGQAWDNIEPNPADGSAQTANDYHLGSGSGSGSDDPTFTGTAGDAGAYFLYDGGDYNTFQNTITTFFDNIHKTTGGADFTVFMAYYHITGTAYILGGNRSAAGTNIGLIFYHFAANSRVYVTQRGGTAGATVNSTGTVNGSGWNVVGVSHSHSANNTRIWINDSSVENLSHTFNTTTAAASGVPSICAYSGGTSIAPNGVRVAGVSWFNEYFDDEKAAAVREQYMARHNRLYT